MNTQELRCQSCNKWLDDEDLSCGLSQFCRDCCFEPDNLHNDHIGDDEEYGRD